MKVGCGTHRTRDVKAKEQHGICSCNKDTYLSMEHLKQCCYRERNGFFFSSRRRHTRWTGDWSSDVCSSDLEHFAEVSHSPFRALRSSTPRSGALLLLLRAGWSRALLLDFRKRWLLSQTVLGS